MEEIPRQGVRQLPRHNTREFSGFEVEAVYRKNINRYDSEQGKGRDARENSKDMVRLKDKFNEKAKGR